MYLTTAYYVDMRDSAVRVEAGISLRKAAKMIGVSDNTLRIYEIDPGSVRSDGKRASIAKYYERLRRFVYAEAAE